MRKLLLLALAWAFSLQAATPNDEGGISGGFRWLYLQTAPTDGDFETGTKLTLTDDPPNLNAKLQQLEPSWQSSYQGFLAYHIPCTHVDVDVNYLYSSPRDQFTIDDLTENQFFQNFLGGGYLTFTGSGKQRIQDLEATVGANYLVDCHLNLRPFLGISYAHLSREMDVRYDDFLFSPPPSFLTGREDARYWGVGPTVGFDFEFLLAPCFTMEGRVSGGALIGKSRSKLSAISTEQGVETTFDASDSYNRVAPILENTLALVYRPDFQFCNIGMEIKIGYQTNYYFKVLDRIDPFDGFVVNPEPFPVRTTANLGFAAPFVELSLVSWDGSRANSSMPSYSYDQDREGFGLYGEVKGLWLKPEANNDDLLYAVLHKADGSTKGEKNRFNYHLNGMYTLGYQGCRGLDVHVQYFRMTNSDTTSVEAGEGEFLRSIDSSGPVFVDFQKASSRAHYDLKQWDVVAGKRFDPWCAADVQLSIGLRYADLERVLHHRYEDGFPPEVTSSKRNRLTSHYIGLGPLASLEANYDCFQGFGLLARGTAAYLMGHLRSTLDQVNVGDLGTSSNTLRTPWTCFLVPVVDAEAGIFYHTCFSGGFGFDLEAGYRFSEYFRAVNLVFPNFLTGLQQTNSDLKLHGPYVKLGVSF